MLERKYFIERGIAGSELASYLITTLHDARATTFNYIKDITQEELDWQPYAEWNTIGALVSHIISCDYFFKIYFIENRALTATEEKQWLPGLELGKYVNELRGKPFEYYSTELTKAHEEIAKAVNNLSNEKLLEKRFDVYDKINGSDLAWTIYHKAEDEVHHRGQISILRKLYQQLKTLK